MAQAALEVLRDNLPNKVNERKKPPGNRRLFFGVGNTDFQALSYRTAGIMEQPSDSSLADDRLADHAGVVGENFLSFA